MLLKTRVNGHFGELLQGRMGPSGPVALITLPCPALQMRAQSVVAPRLELYSPQRVVSAQTARDFLTLIGTDNRQRIILNSAMPPGGGAGASTAALVALARLSGVTDPQNLARACLKVEGATDPLMFARPERLLWASRRAQVLDHLPALPKFEVLGGFWGPMSRTAPHDTNFADISDLIPKWRKAAAEGDLAGLSALCSQSAARNLSLRGSPDDPTRRLATQINALGIVVAHTGAARGFIFARGTCPPEAPTTLRQAGFSNILRFIAGGQA